MFLYFTEPSIIRAWRCDIAICLRGQLSGSYTSSTYNNFYECIWKKDLVRRIHQPAPYLSPRLDPWDEKEWRRVGSGSRRGKKSLTFTLMPLGEFWWKETYSKNPENGGDLCPSRLIESLIKSSLTILSHLGARTIKWLPCFQGKSETSLTYGSPTASERHRCAVLMGGAQTRWRRTSGQVKDEAECHMWPQGQSLGEPGEDSVGREQGLKSKTDVCSLSGSNVHIVPT